MNFLNFKKKQPNFSLIDFVPLFILLVFASTEFFLILRHKSPYTSDTYFYKHIFYVFQGQGFSQAYQSVISQIDMNQQDTISQNFYKNIVAYKNSLSFFTKRPLYPLLSLSIYTFAKNEYLSFLLPVFFAYIISIGLSYKLANLFNSRFVTVATVSFLIGFYPFLDLSTYFLTDTIGFAFWLALILLMYQFIIGGKKSTLVNYTFVLILSLLNREQSILLTLGTAVVLLLFRLYNFPKVWINREKLLFLVTGGLSIIYIFTMFLFKQRNLYDTLLYTQQHYGLLTQQFSVGETINYLLTHVYTSHVAFIKDLYTHHWWLMHFFLAFLGIIFIFMKLKKPRLLDVLLLTSGLGSYFAIFLYPVLSYRYFFPVVLSICFFSVRFLNNYLMKNKYDI